MKKHNGQLSVVSSRFSMQRVSVVVLMLLLIISLFLNISQAYSRDFITVTQAHQIAEGQALRNCLTRVEDLSICKSLKLDDQQKIDMGPTDNGPDHWIFDYGSDANGKTYHTLVVVDVTGNLHTYEESLNWN